MGKKQPLEIPLTYGIVELNIHRSSIPNPNNFEFCKSLNLNCILSLAQITLGLNKSSKERHLNDNLIKEAIEIILNKQKYPILICCESGIHQTGVAIGCLRKLQKWTLNSIISEYSLFAGEMTKNYIGRLSNVDFIEFFDTDLVNLPKNMPEFFLVNEKLLKEEEKFFEKQTKRFGVENLMNPTFLGNIIENNKEIEAYKLFLFCQQGPLISSRSSFNPKKSIIKQDY
eukprot:gene9994-2313_t